MTTTASLFDGKLFKSGLFNGGIFESEGITLASLIASLFGASEQGGLYLPGLDTCYTDNGTTLCTAPGQLVYRMNDLSGNGNHAIQATGAARPALGRTVEGGRRNLLTHTTELVSIYNLNIVRTTDVSLGGGYTGTRLATSSAGGSGLSAYRYMALSVVAGASYTLSAILKEDQASRIVLRLEGDFVSYASETVFNLSAGTVQIVGGGVTASISPLGSGVYRCSITIASAFATGGSGGIWLRLVDDSGGGTIPQDGSNSVLCAGVQLEQAATASDYQRVGATDLDVTEVGKEELWYIKFDGVDDLLQTATAASMSEFHALATAVSTNVVQASGTAFDTIELKAASGVYNSERLAVINQESFFVFRSHFENYDDFASTDCRIIASTNPLPATVLLQERITSTSLKKYINGVLRATRTSETATPVNPAVYKFGPHGTVQFNQFNLFANCVRENALTDSQRQQLHELLAARSGATFP